MLRDDIGIVEQHELEEAEKELCRLADQLSQHGSFQEAEKQLREASFHGEITAIGDRYRYSLQTGGRSVQTGKVPSAAFDAMANVYYSTDIIKAPWGDEFRGVRYREADLDRLWPPRAAVANKPSDEPPLAAGAEAPETPASDQKPDRPKPLSGDGTNDALTDPEVAAAHQWLLKAAAQEKENAERENRPFRKLRLIDNELRQACVKEIGAKWRNYDTAFKNLAEDLREKPRRPKTQRL